MVERQIFTPRGTLMASAAKVSIRGAVAMTGGYAFFHPLADRRIDEQDLLARLSPVTELINTALHEHGLSRRSIAIGYSNGTIMAAAVLQTDPEC